MKGPGLVCPPVHHTCLHEPLTHINSRPRHLDHGGHLEQPAHLHPSDWPFRSLPFIPLWQPDEDRPLGVARWLCVLFEIGRPFAGAHVRTVCGVRRPQGGLHRPLERLELRGPRGALLLQRVDPHQEWMEIVSAATSKILKDLVTSRIVHIGSKHVIFGQNRSYSAEKGDIWWNLIKSDQIRSKLGQHVQNWSHLVKTGHILAYLKNQLICTYIELHHIWSYQVKNGHMKVISRAIFYMIL